METITIPQSIQSTLIALVKNSDFYNKFQISYDFSDVGQNTETFYYFQGIWGHTIFKELKTGESEVVEDMAELATDDRLVERLSALPPDSKVTIAGNSGDNILSLKF